MAKTKKTAATAAAATVAADRIAVEVVLAVPVHVDDDATKVATKVAADAAAKKVGSLDVALAQLREGYVAAKVAAAKSAADVLAEHGTRLAMIHAAVWSLTGGGSAYLQACADAGSPYGRAYLYRLVQTYREQCAARTAAETRELAKAKKDGASAKVATRRARTAGDAAAAKVTANKVATKVAAGTKAPERTPSDRVREALHTAGSVFMKAKASDGLQSGPILAEVTTIVLRAVALFGPDAAAAIRTAVERQESSMAAGTPDVASPDVADKVARLTRGTKGTSKVAAA